MRFSLRSILYVIALLTAAFAACGPEGLFLALVVAFFWGLPFQITKIYFSFKWLVLYITFFLASFMSLTLIHPAFQSGYGLTPERIKYRSCKNNMKQLGLGLYSYINAKGSLPPAYVKDANAKHLHSWRMLILPYIEETSLFNKCAVDKAWDDPSNTPFSQSLVFAYVCRPSRRDETKPRTNYFAVVDERTAFGEERGTKLDEFNDGPGNTLLLMEVYGRNVQWAEPNDLTFDEAIEILTTKDLKKSGCDHKYAGKKYFGTLRLESTPRRSITMADGRVCFIPMSISRKDAIALLTKSGGEDFSIDSLDLMKHQNWYIVWKHVYALAMLVIVIFLPAPWAFRHRRRMKSNAENIAE